MPQVTGHGLTSLDGNSANAELGAEYLADMEGDITPETATFRGGGSNPGKLTPRPGIDDSGKSITIKPRPGMNVSTTVCEAISKGFTVIRDGINHVSVTIVNMEEWIGSSESAWTALLKEIVTKV